MEDHHVDRPEVEAGQPAQLTGTNRSIGLIPGGSLEPPRRNNVPPDNTTVRAQRQDPGPPNLGKPGKSWAARGAARPPMTTLRHFPASHHSPTPQKGRLAGLVAIARGQTPDPIPNSAVKTLCANGTAAPAAEE